MSPFTDIAQAIRRLQSGKMLIVVDNPDRENEGDFYIPAEKVTPQIIQTMIRFGGGLICSAMTKEYADRFDFPLMVNPERNTEKTGVNFTISFNAKTSITTGVSAFDRAHTIKTLIKNGATKEDFTRPGHVFGLLAKDGGVLARTGHTEAAVDLARLSGCKPAGVLCEIIADNGHMATGRQLQTLAEKLNLKMIAISDLVDYRQSIS